MYTLFVTEAHEGIINFIDAIPNVVNFGEFCELLIRVIDAVCLALILSWFQRNRTLRVHVNCLAQEYYTVALFWTQTGTHDQDIARQELMAFQFPSAMCLHFRTSIGKGEVFNIKNNYEYFLSIFRMGMR